MRSPAQPDQGKRWLVHGRVVQATFFLVGLTAAAYLWAVLFGDAMPGLKSGAALDNSNSESYPGANVAFIAAVVAYLSSPFAAWWWSDFAPGHRHTFMWFASTAMLGAAVFALSRLFV